MTFKDLTKDRTFDNCKGTWVSIKGYEGLYEVSNLGEVRSLSRQVPRGKHTLSVPSKVLKKGLGGTGYYIVVLNKEGVSKSHNVHSLVAVAFHNFTPNGFIKVIDHKNEIKTDNRAHNLQIVSHRFNTTKANKKKKYKHTGVCRDNTRDKWKASIYYKGVRESLGRFNTEEEAGNAYQKRLKEILATSK